MESGRCCRKGEASGKQPAAASRPGERRRPGPDLTAPHAFASLPPGSAADLSEAEPTLTHMSIARLHEQKLVRAQCGCLVFLPGAWHGSWRAGQVCHACVPAGPWDACAWSVSGSAAAFSREG